MFNLDWIYSYCVSFYYLFLRRMVKWFMHHVTGKCELLRILDTSRCGGHRTKSIEKCLSLSRNGEVKRLVQSYSYDIKQAVDDVKHMKGILTDQYTIFDDGFTMCLRGIAACNHLLNVIEVHRKTQYNSHIEQHEEMLLRLWEIMVPDEPLVDRISDQWTQIGFQGNDPATDFRGMGILGLEQLVYFGVNQPVRCAHVLSMSQHPTKGYSYAIVGINLTSMLYHLMKKRKLRSHFYNLPPERTSLTEINDLYCYLFYEFDKYWTKKNPSSIMEFNRIREKFHNKLINRLEMFSLPLNVDESLT